MTAKNGAGWKPRFALELKSASKAQFDRLVEQFADWIKAEPPTGPLPVTAGWNDITPEIAENLLRRNQPNGNRPVRFSNVGKFAKQMLDKDWRKTGQPLIIDVRGIFKDGGHRAWAG